MPTLFLTPGDDSRTLIDSGTYVIDGLGGVDTLLLGTSLRSAYTIIKNADGSIQVDAISGASGENTVFHATLYNMELLKFNSGNDTLDLRIAFADTTAPLISRFNPADHSIHVPVASNITITFNEDIQRGVGSIVLRDGSDATLAVYDASSSSRLTISGTTLTLDPSTNLPPGSYFSIEITPGSIRDLSGNNFAGQASYGFTTLVNSADPVWNGSSGRDVFKVPLGNFSGNGLAGLDKLVFAQALPAYALTKTTSGYSVVATDSSSNTTISQVERLEFTDTHVALDLGGTAGTVAKILGAVFSPAAVHNTVYAGIGLKLMDDGMTYTALMQLALDAALGAGASHTAVVHLLYSNVVGSAPDADELAYYVGLLDSRAFTPATLGILAADHALNVQRIDLVGLEQTGLAYVPYLGG